MKTISNAILTEMKTVRYKIQIACADAHGGDVLCAGCVELGDYAMRRLALCQFGGNKPTCLKCPVHCYKPAMKDRIREVMRRAGPKMLSRHPWLTLVHFWKERRARPTAARAGVPRRGQTA